jgi:hypothetical protein
MLKPKTDLPTLIAISAFSFILAIALHEHGGHSLTCLALGGHVRELGAFYVECDPASLSGLANRLVALAGPLASLLAGALAMAFFGRASSSNTQRKYFLWHFATVNLMVAAGYLLFSGVSGIGDFGMDQYGLFYQAAPEWLFRAGLFVLGLAGYIGVILLSLRQMDTFIGGEGSERVGRAQALALTSYLTGAIVSVLIGLLNPYGIIIVLISSLSSSMGGTSGLAWMMQMLNRKKDTGMMPFALERSRAWIIASLAFILVYALVLGPTIHL